MNTFPMRTESDQYALGISDLIASLVAAISSKDPDWEGAIERFEQVISLHRHSGLLRGVTATNIVFWNTGVIFVRALEASEASPALWARAIKPLEVLSERMGIDLYTEFARVGLKP